MAFNSIDKTSFCLIQKKFKTKTLCYEGNSITHKSI